MNPLEKYSAKEIRDEFYNAEAVIKEGKGGVKAATRKTKAQNRFNNPMPR